MCQALRKVCGLTHLILAARAGTMMRHLVRYLRHKSQETSTVRVDPHMTLAVSTPFRLCPKGLTRLGLLPGLLETVLRGHDHQLPSLQTGKRSLWRLSAHLSFTRAGEQCSVELSPNPSGQLDSEVWALTDGSHGCFCRCRV